MSVLRKLDRSQREERKKLLAHVEADAIIKKIVVRLVDEAICADAETGARAVDVVINAFREHGIKLTRRGQ